MADKNTELMVERMIDEGGAQERDPGQKEQKEKAEKPVSVADRIKARKQRPTRAAKRT